MQPTSEEYAEAKGLDIDPDTFDKATYKRVRSMGATHDEVKDALTKGIPIEDYETARINNNSHDHAVNEALGYQEEYKKTMFRNDKIISGNPEAFEKIKGIIQANEPYINDHIEDIFGHHAALKNKPQFDSVYPDRTDRRRANEWMMSECAKIHTGLKQAVKTKKYNDDGIMPIEDYNKKINLLLNNYSLRSMFTSNTLPEKEAIKNHIVHNRIANVLVNLGSGYYTPTNYTQEKYEEE